MSLQRIWIPSPNLSSRRGNVIRLAVLHTTEGAKTYQALGAYFARAASQVSSHVGIDDTPNTVGEYVHPASAAWTAAAANTIAVQAELCAFSAWDRGTWLQHPVMLDNAGAWVGEECARNGLPVLHLTAAQAQDGHSKGVCMHADLGAAGGGHWDCGPSFPWDVVMARAGGGSPHTGLNGNIVGMSATRSGYYLFGADGGVFTFGDAKFYGSLGATKLNAAIVGGVARVDGSGYYLVASDGGIFTFGPGCPFLGSLGSTKLNAPVAGILCDPDGTGYWLFAADGGVFTFDAPFYGSVGSAKLNKPIVAGAVVPGGYILAGSDGGVFTFGAAKFYGSAGAIRLNKPVVAMSAQPDGSGYTLCAADGGIFTYGSAPYYGGTGNVPLSAPVVAMASDPDGAGYWLAAEDGGVFSFNAQFFGALPT